MTTKKILIVFILLILSVLGSLYYFFWLKPFVVKFSTQNDIDGYSFTVSSIAGNLFFYTQKYNVDYKEIKVIFTPLSQDSVEFNIEGTHTPTSSMGVEVQKDTLLIKEQYSKNALISIMNGSSIRDFKINPDEDIYAYLCLVFDEKKPSRDECYEIARKYIEKIDDLPFSIKMVNSNKKFSLRLINKVLAGCSGTIPCGKSYTGYFCTGTSTPVACWDYSDCPSGQSCKYQTLCNTSQNIMNCSSLSSESVCRTAGVDECASGCNKSAENFCTWYDPVTPTPTPAPTTAPTTPPSSITMQTVVALDKNRNGVFDDGYYQVIEDPADTNCGTFPNITGLTVSYSGAASGTINYHTGCVGSTYNYPYSTKAIAAAGNFTFTLSGIPSNYSLKWVEEGTGKCTLSGGVVTCTGLVSGQTYGIWFFLQETGVPNCKNLTGPTSLYVGETGTFTATYEDGTGSIDQRGLAIYSEGQCEPNTSAYWNRIDGGPGTQSFNWVPSAAGIYDVDCRAWDAGVSECRGRCYGIAPYYTYQCVGTGGGATTTRKVTVLTPVLSWWQVKDSDILANGDVRSNVPASNYFDLAGAGGFPGVPIFSGSTNLTSTNVSAKKWMAKTSYVSNKVYGSSYFVNLIPSGATINSVTSTSVPGSFFASGGTAYNGYYWYVYDGAANGGVDLTITSGASLGARKVILIVKNANLNLQGNINLTKGSGFFLGITSGNLNVSPTVGGAGPNLEGIYIADGTFSSGTGGTKTDSQLSVRGTVAAYGGINLQRDLGNVNNSTTPAEYFEYAPDLELLFPKELATRVTNWREVAP